MTWFSLVVPLTLLFSNLFSQQTALYSQQGIVTSPHQLSPELRARIERDRQTVMEIDDLAGRIHSLADAEALVDKIAEIFSDTLPPAWITETIRQRLARAEFAAVSDPSQLIPEQRLLDVWNSYVYEIGASDEAPVTAAELHNLRDADFAIAQYLWPRGQNIWAVPSIYALGPNGKLAGGCRAVEALRVLYDLDMQFDNLRSARERVRRGTLASEELRKSIENPPENQKTTGRLEARTGTFARLGTHVDTNPVRAAEHRYVQQHGPYILSAVMEKLFNELFPLTN
jgi:hypothetical protein